MAYYSDNWTDKELEALEKRIAKVFKQAEKDLDKEVKEYFAKFNLRDKEMQQLVQTGDVTPAEYQRWRMTQIGRGQRFEALRDKVAERYTQANEVANAYVNDMTPSIYSLNRNYEAYTIEKTVGSCDFTMWDESTVRRLLVEQPDLMPYYPPSRALNRGIDLAYGKSQITKHVTSGIIRGLAPGKIAKELMSNITTMNRESAVRAARTGITAAQNAGRMDSYVAAEKMGIQIKRRWVCTKDSRTRLAHGMADGQIAIGTKKPFNVGGELMMFPGDTSMGAHGWNIYNCRCTTRTVEKDGIEAEPREMRVRNPQTGKWELVNEMTYSEWEQWKKTGEKPVAKSENSSTMKVDIADVRKKLKSINADVKDIETQLRTERRKQYYARGTDKDNIAKEIDRLNKQLEDLNKKKLEQGKLLVENMNTSFKVSGNNEKFVSLILDLDSLIDYKEVFKHTSPIADIINTVGGGDNTVGSCASVGLAYIGQKNGWNVLDFRDGKSRDWFGGKLEKLRIWDSLGVKYITEDSAKSNLTNGKRILSQMVKGKEYYLSVGRHAAVVRAVDDPILDAVTGEVKKIGTKYQYLELQHSTKSGWKDFDKDARETLKWRFACTSSSNYYAPAYLTDIDSVADNDEFRTILGYINTEESKQRKGIHGTIK